MERRTNEQTYKRMNERMNERTYVRTNRQMEKWKLYTLTYFVCREYNNMSF